MGPLETATAPARSDAELLREFVETNSEDSFSELRARHVNWVFSTALRQVGDRATAEDVTQAVFTILALKARRLKAEIVLSAWLFRVVRYTAIDAIRREVRRRQREQIAVETNLDDAGLGWEEVSPMVDECLAKLRSADQKAILLRFYEQKPWRDVGAALGLNENAARVRVDRALEKLRTLLHRRGVTSTTQRLHGLLLANCVQNAPPTISFGEDTETVAALVRAYSRRWWVRRLLLGSLVVSLLVCGASFFAIPKSQNDRQEVLLGAAPFAALVDIDRGFWTGDAPLFLSRIYFRNAADETYRETLREFIVVQSEFRRALASASRDPEFGYYATLDIIDAGRKRPLHFGVNRDRAVGAFSRKRGIELVRVGGIWKWDFFSDFPTNRLARVQTETRRLRLLNERLASGADPGEVLREFSGTAAD